MYKNVEDLIEKLSPRSEVEATKELTRFFVSARFNMVDEQFSQQYVDGKDDGGIDFFHTEDNTFFIIQSKFSSKPRKTDEESLLRELKKIINTLAGQNPNKRAEGFVNDIRRSFGESTLLEIIWITTNIVDRSLADMAQKELHQARKQNNWELNIDFVAFDRNALQRMVYDRAHGYIPYTGKKALNINGRYIENLGDGTGIYSIVCTAQVTDILKWFRQKDDVKKFLQKNIREYVGDNKINKAIQQSYIGTPDWFWHKHNGIILFADSISKSSDGSQLILRNPQVVNGGQTLIALFSAHDKVGRKDSTAQILVRAYNLPYEESETYKKSIDIIKALNSQNPIRASDLHSTDPRQVRIEALMKQMGYKYWRKRGKEVKSGRYAVTMRNLALYYYVCKRRTPHEGVLGQIEELFDEETKYDAMFPEHAINRELSLNHVVLNYVTLWMVAEILDGFVKYLPTKYERELSQYTRYFVLVDIYNKLIDWRREHFNLPGWRNWKDFVESDELEDSVWKYAHRPFMVATGMVPKKEEPRKFFKRKEASERFDRQLVGSTRSFNAAMNGAFSSFKNNLQNE